MKNLSTWISKNRLEFVAIATILIFAAFLRLYQIDKYMTFLGDEGRDALVIKKILVEKDYPLLGPPTSIGNMYLGPLYYYMMAVPMAVFWMNPVAAAVQVGLIGVAAVFLVYYLSRAWFNKWAALVASFLYAVSPVNIVLTRSSWNPNPAPFFALLAILGMYKINKTGNFWWLVLAGIALAFAVQMHYLALILLPIMGVIWLYEVVSRRIKKEKSQNLVKGTLIAIVIFLVLMSPLAIFDFKYNWMNYRAISTFFTNRETTVNLNVFNTFERIIPIYNEDLVGRFIVQENPLINPVISILIILPILYAFFIALKKKKIIWSLMALGVWLIIGVLGLALYKQSIYDHYLGFLNPVPFLVLGATFFLIQTSRIKIKKYILGFLAILFIVIGWINLQNNPLTKTPNNQLAKTQEIARYVIQESQNKPFNFALLAKSNYDSAYQFYLDQFGHKPEQVPFVITDQLFVVCEDLECQPVGNPKYEIAGFGWSKVDSVSEFAGVKVFKLVHNEEEK